MIWTELGHSPSKIVIQPVEKIIYDQNSSTRLKNIKKHETELKWIKFLQSPFPLGFNDNTYHEGNISKMPDFDVFSVLECKKRKSRSHGKRKNGNIKRKICTEKRLNTSLMPRLHLPLSSYDLFVYDFPCDFFGIVGGYKLRRMCSHCLRSPYDFFRRQIRTNLTKTLRISYDNPKVIVQSSCYLHDLPI